MVLWGIEVPPFTPDGGTKRRRYGSGILRSTHCSYAILLGERFCHIWHSRIWAAGPGRPGGLDHLVHRSGHLEHNLDVQDCPWLLQSLDRERRPKSWSGETVLCRWEACQQPHRLMWNDEYSGSDNSRKAGFLGASGCCYNLSIPS